MKKQFILAILVYASYINLVGQDSSVVLSQDEFLAVVLKNHPLVKQAKLISEKGEINLQGARGKFDPVLYNYFNQKDFNNKNYFSILNAGVKIPTWFGIEGKINYDNSTGYYLNPENSLPTSGLLSAGISIPIAKGLLIDDRRAQLAQAKNFVELSEVEQFNVINKILYDATSAYWEWVMAYNHFRIYENAVELAEIRFESVKKSFYQGSEPAIDTLEAFIQLQNRQSSNIETNLEYTKAKLILSNFLWAENDTPLELDSNVFPPEILDEFHNYIHAKEDIETYSYLDIELHPLIQAYNLKIKNLEIEKRYKAENLKPKLNLNYNFLSEPLGNNQFSQFSTQNYKFGLEFNMPLFIREARSGFKMAKVKLQETDYDRIQKRREIENKIQALQTELENLEKQEQIFTINTVNYERLLSAEKQKFQMGESSLFLINSREIQVIESQIKLINIRGKYRKAIANLLFTSGKLIATK